MKSKQRLFSSKSQVPKNSKDIEKDRPFKIFNLSELINLQVAVPSDTIMRNMLSSQRSTRNQDTQKFKSFHSTKVKEHQRMPLKINYQHYRSKSTSTIKNYYDSIKSPFQNNKDDTKKTNFQINPLILKSKSLILSREVEGVSLTSSFKSQQILSKNSFKIHNFAFRQELYANSKNKSNEAMFTMSLDFKKNNDQNQTKKGEESYKDHHKEKFLKKGSSLKKQIVINLLKNKLIKEHEKNIKKQYAECDILNMLKLYKGFLGFPKPKTSIKNPSVSIKPAIDKNSKQIFKKQNSILKEQEFLRTCQSLPERIVEKYSKPIIGWETSPELDIQDFKNDQNTQITMDHSYGFS